MRDSRDRRFLQPFENAQANRVIDQLSVTAVQKIEECACAQEQGDNRVLEAVTHYRDLVIVLVPPFYRSRASPGLLERQRAQGLGSRRRMPGVSAAPEPAGSIAALS